MFQLFVSRYRYNNIKAPTLAALLVIGFVITAIPLAIESAGSGYLIVRANGDTVLLAPVHNNVTVYRDDWGVPHIYAQDTHDAYYALGYAMAQDRLFEMDLFRRAVSGRLAEIFNGLMFADDVVMRTLGPYQIALDTWNGLYPGVTIPDDVKENLERFSDGVNRYISDMVIPDDVPTEYRIISLQTGGAIPVEYFVPYPWTPPDSVAIAGMMGLMLTDSSQAEIIRGAFVANVDPIYAMAGLPGMSDFLMPTGWVNMTTIMPDPPGGGGGGLGDLGVIEAITAPLQKLLGFSGFTGSNNWVVDDLNTTTGNAMLANDPHLDLQAPGMWWQVHINIPGYTNTIGCMVPGGPVVATGHNDYFAFGVTNLMTDIMDLYYYVSNETHYFYVDHWEPFDVRYETIYNFTDPVLVPVVSTRHGPLITTPLPPPFDKMAVRWAGKESGYGELTGFSLMMNATTLADWKHACSYMSVIAQNFVFADKLGNIAWCPSGKIPLRPPPPPAGTGTLGVAPSNGSAGQNEWMGWLPHSTAPVDLGTGHGPVSLPYVENPDKGYIATANNQPIDPTYLGYPWPIWIGPAYTYDAGYRAQRITELIESLEPISVDDMKTIQKDTICIPARNMVPIILAVMAGESNMTMQNALGILGGWNFNESRDLVAPLIWEVFLGKFADNTFGDELWAAMGLYPFGNTIIPLWNMTQTWMWNPYALALFDDQTTPSAGPMTPGFELMPEIVNRSLHDALDWIASQLGPNMANWQYGNLHVVDFNHPMGRLSPMLEYLNVPPGPNVGGPGPMGMDGGPYTVNPGGHHHELFVPTGPEVLFVENGASYRGIYECYDDWGTSLILVPPGESGSIKGHPISPSLDPHYDDTFLMWLNYQYTPCLYDDGVIQTKQKTTFMKPPFQTWDFYKTQYEQTFHIAIESNSTDVASFAFYRAIKKIQFEVTGFDCTIGVCNVAIPKALLNADPGDWEVVVDSTPVTPVVTENATHSFLYFSYHHSVHPVEITGTSVIGPPVGGIATPIDIVSTLFIVAIMAVLVGVAIGFGTIGVFIKRGKEKR